MPIFLPKRAMLRVMNQALCKARPGGAWVVGWLLAAMVAGAGGAALSQTLARPGLVGSGLSTDAWWQHAIFYEVELGRGDVSPGLPTDFKSIAATLDSLRSLGVDALLVPAPHTPAHSVTGSLAAITPNAGPDPVLDDFDDLIHQSSRRGMRVLLNLPVPSDGTDVTGIARFWLSRGVAGFHVVAPSGTAPQTAQTVVQTLRKVTAGVVGQRIVLSDFDPSIAAASAGAPSRGAPARRTDRLPDPVIGQLRIDARISHVGTLDAATLRPLLGQTSAQPTLLLEFHSFAGPGGSRDSAAALAKAMAAVVLTIHPSALVDSSVGLVLEKSAEGQVGGAVPPIAVAAPPSQPAVPPGTYVPYVPAAPAQPVAAAPKAAVPAAPADPLTAWYQELATLHHANAALRFGSATLLNFDAQNALVWVVRPATASALTPPVVVACNLSGSPVTLGIGAAIKGMGLRGDYLRTLLRSDKAMGPQDLDAVVLPAYGVYVGELRR
jgi:hypothetical protein